MEAVAVAKALKPSLRREFMVQEMLRKDMLCLRGNTVAGGEDFSVDELFDFSNSSLLYEQQEYDEDKESLTASSQSQDREEGDSSSNFTYDTLISTELAIPVQGDELEDLEWVSHFVDDCVQIGLEEEKGAGKKRKKARTVGNRKAKEGVWRWVPEKKAQIERRCSHCKVKKTPQWRKGPMGPKTLCNACGVRYKLGRLFWEYRPACSPTFCGDIHSNSHRKVMEIRKLKGVAASPHP